MSHFKPADLEDIISIEEEEEEGEEEVGIRPVSSTHSAILRFSGFSHTVCQKQFAGNTRKLFCL